MLVHLTKGQGLWIWIKKKDKFLRALEESRYRLNRLRTGQWDQEWGWSRADTTKDTVPPLQGLILHYLRL